MRLEEIIQVIMLTQDANKIGWDFKIENNTLKAIDRNFEEDDVVFKNENQLLEWLEDQFDAET
ncbi:hypothetical protein DS745_01600 [Anaerobacillus alkaliphilus]|uniref:Uncharacterized protein n=1 Tax=Anaerobacillus alkaliphilus TaxID=1548597 RepID=A0A4Q0VY41_9BACI|nr:hypothetical protein [Anaerobacillus alkaliphilus]RXJ04106.1 hypothetical protein DS745_01600 [Anaerobacillus alkaliphilus]